MPTNKLWLEHTEKAAWESVQALREKIVQAERRIERLGPPVAAWQPLLDELDQARGELELPDASDVDVLRALLDRARRDRERAEELERARRVSVQPSTPPPTGEFRSQPFDVTALMRSGNPNPFDDEDDDPQPSRALAQVERDLERRRRELMAERALPSNVDALLRLIDAKVADLGDVDGWEFADAALDLGVLAVALAAESSDADE